MWHGHVSRRGGRVHGGALGVRLGAQHASRRHPAPAEGLLRLRHRLPRRELRQDFADVPQSRIRASVRIQDQGGAPKRKS